MQKRRSGGPSTMPATASSRRPSDLADGARTQQRRKVECVEEEGETAWIFGEHCSARIHTRHPPTTATEATAGASARRSVAGRRRRRRVVFLSSLPAVARRRCLSPVATATDALERRLPAVAPAVFSSSSLNTRVYTACVVVVLAKICAGSSVLCAAASDLS